ncbi:MAG: hypothetical protein AB8F74_07685 [Saprospiraceae bacterium]
MIVTFKKLFGGEGYYAEIVVSLIESISAESQIVDNCTWANQKAIHNNINLGPGHLEWKKYVLKGMEYALRKIRYNNTIKISLDDLTGHILHTSNSTMYAVGIISVFKLLSIDIRETDHNSINNLVKGSRSFNSKVKIEDFQISEY